MIMLTAALCGAQPSDLSNTASAMIAHVNVARQAAHSHDQTAAAAEIREAQSLATQILSRSGTQSQPVMIALRQETETTTTYADVKHGKGGEMSPDRLKKHTHVGDVEQETHAVSVNVTAAAEALRAAQSDVERMDWAAAETHLGTAGAVSRVESASREMPLPRVQKNLELARTRLAEHKQSAAVLPLREAAVALSDFEKMDAGRAPEAARMRSNMEAMAKHIKDQGSTDTIDSWLRTIEQWQKP